MQANAGRPARRTGAQRRWPAGFACVRLWPSEARHGGEPLEAIGQVALYDAKELLLQALRDGPPAAAAAGDVIDGAVPVKNSSSAM